MALGVREAIRRTFAHGRPGHRTGNRGRHTLAGRRRGERACTGRKAGIAAALDACRQACGRRHRRPSGSRSSGAGFSDPGARAPGIPKRRLLAGGERTNEPNRTSHGSTRRHGADRCGRRIGCAHGHDGGSRDRRHRIRRLSRLAARGRRGGRSDGRSDGRSGGRSDGRLLNGSRLGTRRCGRLRRRNNHRSSWLGRGRRRDNRARWQERHWIDVAVGGGRSPDAEMDIRRRPFRVAGPACRSDRFSLRNRYSIADRDRGKVRHRDRVAHTLDRDGSAGARNEPDERNDSRSR